jgi:hypothetical protein
MAEQNCDAASVPLQETHTLQHNRLDSGGAWSDDFGSETQARRMQIRFGSSFVTRRRILFV